MLPLLTGEMNLSVAASLNPDYDEPAPLRPKGQMSGNDDRR